MRSTSRLSPFNCRSRTSAFQTMDRRMARFRIGRSGFSVLHDRPVAIASRLMPRPRYVAATHGGLRRGRCGGTSDRCLQSPQHCRMASARSASAHRALPASSRSCRPFLHRTTRALRPGSRATLRKGRSFPSLAETVRDNFLRLAPRFVALESENHALLAEEPAWAKFVSEIEAFLSDAG
jgi:hypothetical protein